jgi:phosphoribosylaminoimidazolecarboxamide formyltransferase/IMP cyclohydrolase
VQDLRYGENRTSRRRSIATSDPSPERSRRIGSSRARSCRFNNLADSDAAWECAKSLASVEGAACVIVKHANPCGVAVADTPLAAYRNAFATDPVSAFGGIIAFNRPIDAPTLEAVSAQVPRSAGRARIHGGCALGDRPEEERPRAGSALAADAPSPQADMKRIGGGLLVQSADARSVAPSELQVVTRKAPTATSCAISCSRGASPSS